MRILGALTALSGVFGSDTDCPDRQIRLWLHLDLTASFFYWRDQCNEPLKKALTSLSEKYPNLKFGVSGFGDRPRAGGQLDDACYVKGVDFNDPVDDTKFDKIKDLVKQERDSFVDLEEDPFEAMPWIAKNVFGDYVSDELRIFVHLTDYGPHYGPKYETYSDATPDKLPEDYVTCSNLKRYWTLDELFDPVKIRRIFPLALVYPKSTCVTDWRIALKGAGYTPEDHLFDMGSDYSLSNFVDAIEKTIGDNQCSPAPTNTPSQGTIPTDAPSTTTTASTTTASTTTESSTTVTTTVKPTTTAHSTGGTTQAEHHTVPIVLGAAAGAAGAAAAIGFAIRYFRPTAAPADLEVGGNAVGVTEVTMPDRETAINIDEASYDRR